MRKHGFSLVELSIVLVILGLLVGGVLAGQSLIRAAEVRSVSSEQSRYRAAIYAFRDKYVALPGDMANATSFWGDQATGTSACASAATADGTPGTCNGDGNGIVGPVGFSGTEGVRAWQQLAFAGLIEGNYTGYYDTSKLTIGLNVPASRYPKTGWAYLYRGTAASSTGVWDKPSNYLQTGSENNNELWGYAYSPEDAWNIDTKLDDGIPDQGTVLAHAGSGAGCVTPAAASWNTGSVAGRTYQFTSTGCTLYFRM